VRILQISSAKTFSGTERHFVDLCRELARRGHEVFVALRPTNEWEARLDFLPEERFLRVSVRNSFGMFSAKRIARFIGPNRIEVVHAHLARDYLAASVAVRSAGDVRLVLTRHLMSPMKPFHRFALRNVSAAIGVSPAVGGQLSKIFRPDKVRVITNGIAMSDRLAAQRNRELGLEFRRSHSLPLHAPLVVTLGELRPLKGQRDLVLAANEIVKEIPDCHFVIAGLDHSIDKKFRRELKRLVRIFGLDERFLWLDWLDDTSPLLAAADLFVSPSHSESFGLAILEAMAAGTPVISTATDGARHLLGDLDVLVPVKDPLALADKICLFLKDENARREASERAIASARARFGLDQMVTATEAVYRSVIERA